MVRTPPSAADQLLLQLVADCGTKVSGRQLERWRARPWPLLPANPRSRPGRPVGGSTSTTNPAVVDLVVWLGQHSRPGADPFYLALGAFGAELPVPEETVREAFTRQVVRLAERMTDQLGPVPATGDVQEWVSDRADEIAQQGARRLTGVNRRIRAIDKQLRQLPAVAELWKFAAGFDPDRADIEPLDNTGVLFHGLAAAVGGADGIAPEVVARIARAQAGREVPQYTAHLLETDPLDPLIAIRHTPPHQLPGLPSESVVNHFLSVAREAPLERLRAGWATAGEMAGWAEALCQAVETELSSEPPGGDACLEWVFGQLFGIGRMYLIKGLAEPSPTPGQQALTALELVFSFDAINKVLATTDADGHETLHRLAPPFLLRLAAVETRSAGPSEVSP
ncbi:hypothetical protein ACIQI7_08890 [Kitasatospora sp. NPDC092039]|uniref:hypothetical protein n=1 Tax=Kitasatospora sp. NPDC092039 TaxID=3364086 RepID=UPI0038153345